MSDKKGPSYSINIVETEKDASGADKARWTEIGVAFPHGDGKGFNLKWPAGLSISGASQIVLREISARNSTGSQKPQQGAQDPYDF